jgi:hypothetical protein
MTIRIPCPVCHQDVGLTARGLLYRHGDCPNSGKPVGRIWPTRHRGRKVRTIPGPDTWNPRQGAA